MKMPFSTEFGLEPPMPSYPESSDHATLNPEVQNTDGSSNPFNPQTDGSLISPALSDREVKATEPQPSNAPTDSKTRNLNPSNAQTGSTTSSSSHGTMPGFYSFQQPAGLSSSATSPFSSARVFPKLNGGSRVVPYNPTQHEDHFPFPCCFQQNLESISAMPAHDGMSHEELRLIDYSLGHRGNLHPSAGGTGIQIQNAESDWISINIQIPCQLALQLLDSIKSIFTIQSSSNLTNPSPFPPSSSSTSLFGPKFGPKTSTGTNSSFQFSPPTFHNNASFFRPSTNLPFGPNSSSPSFFASQDNRTTDATFTFPSSMFDKNRSALNFSTPFGLSSGSQQSESGRVIFGGSTPFTPSED